METVSVAYNAQGELVGFYPDAIAYAAIPDPHVRCDTATHQDAMMSPGKWHVVDGQLVARSPWPPAPTEAQVRAAANAPTLEQIAALERTQTPRLLREAALALPAVNPATGRTAAQQLAWIDTQIAELRAQLQ